MKRYIPLLSAIFLLGSGLYTPTVESAQVKIAALTEGEQSLVDAIKYHSDLTTADVNQYKLLKLGSLDKMAAFVLGAFATFKTGTTIYNNVDSIKGIVPGFLRSTTISNWMPSSWVLAGLGSAGAGLASYKVLYPRIRQGVLDKVQAFIDVCKALESDTPKYPNDQYFYTILNYQFKNQELDKVPDYLPTAWHSVPDVAVYNALENLVEQADRAQLLLTQLGSDDSQVKEKQALISLYRKALAQNKKFYIPIIAEYKRSAKDKAKLANANAQVTLARAKTIETYSSMVTSGIKNTVKGLHYIYDNQKKIAGVLAAVWATALLAKAQAKLGYGQ